MNAKLKTVLVRVLAKAENHVRDMRRRVEGGSSRPMFIGGLRGEWAEFERRHQEFLARLGSLVAAMNAAFGVREGKDPTGAHMAVFFLGRLAAEDFWEIFLLCANGYGIAATKLLRGLYERVVTARYLQQHPDEAEAFMAWGVVNTGKAAQEILSVFGDAIDAKTIAKLREQIEQGKAERHRFMVDDCKKCGTKRLNFTWSKLDFVSMAKSIGEGLTGQYMFPCYLEPLRHAHATVGALEARVKQVGENELTFDSGPTREEAGTALMLAHMLMLNICDLFLNHFKPNGLEDALRKAVDDYTVIWDLPAAGEAPK